MRSCAHAGRGSSVLSAIALVIAFSAFAPNTVSAQPGAPVIALIIDDLGNNDAETRAATQLPGAVACAFLPDAPYTRRYAGLAHDAGKEVLLHLPLQPIDARKAHPMALNVSLADPKRDAELAHMLASVPYLDGVNNHQGSLATANRAEMRWLMHALLLHHVGYFIDSYTSASSLAYPIARAYGLPTARRRVFLDNVETPAAIDAQFDALLKQARRGGAALAIGHPHPATLAVLQRRLPQLAAQGITLIAPSKLIAAYEPAPMPASVALRFSERLAAPLTAMASAVSDAP